MRPATVLAWLAQAWTQVLARLAAGAPALNACVVGVALVGGAALSGLSAHQQQALATADCPLNADSFSLSADRFELAGTATAARALLEPVAYAPQGQALPRPDTTAQRVCLEARERFLRDSFQTLDAGLFMPLYALLSVLLLASAQAGPSGARPRVAAAVLGALTVLLMLDARENRQALALLDHVLPTLLQPGATDAASSTVDLAARRARQASLAKWVASALWCMSLAWAVARGWPWAERRGWARLGQQGSAVALTLAGWTLGITAAWGWMQPAALDSLLRGVAWGMGAAIAGLLLALLVLAWEQLARSHRPPQTPPPGTAPPSPLIPALEEPRHGFHLEEYRQIRSEVVGQLARIEGLARGSVVACALAYSWLVSQSLGVEGMPPVDCLRLPREMLVFAWWLPPALVLMGASMAAVLANRIHSTGHYLRRLEQALGQSPLGWEAHLQPQRSTVTAATAAVWGLLLVLSLSATILGQTRIARADRACEAKVQDKSARSQDVESLKPIA